MKFINIVFLLPLAAFANPIAEPIPEASAMALASAEPETSPNPSQESHLLVARDNVCHIITAGSQGCDWDPYNGKRRTLIKPGMTFGVSCYVTDGKPVGTDKYKRWDYVPGWGCWVSAKWTNSGCESKFGYPSTRAKAVSLLNATNET
ncbi:hypothetical protein GLAREA_04367 [Glarea lozoyensis ATCC 20868]|uniref:Uncharacterized protein n=1 Tax=Glarea lozoyensis (strain ATCC 20868 / MF5171) TaxID=1116229 RepID=S3D687_GLAL2|nr:uncharacterized protein GLAREA_04367 [Glarea lozoyensis ATCC 20868]EPE27576.1 hypothetical protein GLAREA_04367 [Glarea lozoyensis ATCC 20868]